MDALAGLHTFNKVGATRVFRCVDKVDARLIDGDGVKGGEDADVRHAGIFGGRAAVAVDGEVLHDIYKGNLAVKVTHHRRGGVCHCLAKTQLLGVLIPRLHVAVSRAAGVNAGLARAGRAADGELLERAAVAAHRMSLEVGEYQHGVVVDDVFADEIFVQHFTVFDLPRKIRAFGVHQVNVEQLAPAVVLQKFPVLRRLVTHAVAVEVAVGGVALDDGAVYGFHHGTPEFGAKKILIALFAGMHLNGDLAGQRNAQLVIEFNNFFGGNFAGEINLGFHRLSPFRNL